MKLRMLQFIGTPFVLVRILIVLTMTIFLYLGKLPRAYANDEIGELNRRVGAVCAYLEKSVSEDYRGK